MLIYRGAGFWVPIVVLGVFLATIGVQEAIIGQIVYYRWLMGLVVAASGGILWWWGRRLNRPLDEAAEAERKELGAVINKTLYARHSLYGIPMEMWGVAFIGLALGIWLLSAVTGTWNHVQ